MKRLFVAAVAFAAALSLTTAYAASGKLVLYTSQLNSRMLQTRDISCANDVLFESNWKCDHVDFAYLEEKKCRMIG